MELIDTSKLSPVIRCDPERSRPRQESCVTQSKTQSYLPSHNRPNHSSNEPEAFRMRTAILLAFLFSTAVYAQSCAPNATQQSVAAVHALQAKLFAIPEIKDDMPYDAPLSARNDVPSLLNALASAVESYMYCDAKSITTPPEIEQHLAVLLGANRPESATAQRNGYP